MIVIPVMIYYLIESLFISLFVSTAWKLVLYPATNLHIGYFQWVVGIWIIKVIFFDVFKLIMTIPQPPEENNDEYNQQ